MRCLAVACFLPTLALADIPASERWLATDHVAVGLNADGSWVNSAIGLGLLVDPDGPYGPYPVGDDVILVGRAFEAWSIAWTDSSGDHEAVCGAPDLGSDVVFDWQLPVDVYGLTSIRGDATVGPLELTVWVTLPWGEAIVWVTTAIHTTSDVSDVWLARSVDADFDAAVTGSYATWNQAGDGFAAASSDWDGRALALAATDAVGGVCSWCATPQAILDGGANGGLADRVVGIAIEVGDLASGALTQSTLAYAFDVDVGAAIDLAVAAAAEDDLDGDGVDSLDGDCDDRDPDSAPGLIELPDGRDNDCDGTVDEDTSIADDDGDGWAEVDGDCDDGDAAVHPGALPTDGVSDADCDGVRDTPWDDGEALDVEIPRGCGCVVGSVGTSWLVPLLPLLALIRRRRWP